MNWKVQKWKVEKWKVRARCAVMVLAMAAVAARVASAHHSFGGEYDVNKPVTLSGVVTAVEWSNPHSHFNVDVKDEQGHVANWTFQGYPPGVLYRTGWKRDVTIKPGDTITVFGWKARTDPALGAARDVTFANGEKLNAGPPAGTGGR